MFKVFMMVMKCVVVHKCAFLYVILLQGIGCGLCIPVLVNCFKI